MSMTKCPECDGAVSTLAETCPHCGYPLRQKQDDSNEEYVLSKGTATASGFATFLRVLAGITWVGGLIISIAGAQVTEVLKYSSIFLKAATVEPFSGLLDENSNGVAGELYLTII